MPFSKTKKINQWITLVERPIELEDNTSYQLVTVRRGFAGVESRGIFKGKEIKVKNYFVVQAGDFLISKRQIAHGACGIVPESLDGAVVSNEYNVFVPQKETNIEFFFLIMQLPYYKRLFYLMSDGVHIEKLLFKTNDWMKRSLSLPLLPEQQKIAAILSTQDKVIELKEKLLVQKQQQKKYLMQQLLTGRKPHKNNPRIEECEIGEVCKINPKQDKISESQVVFLGMADISETGSVVSQRLVDFSHIQSGFTAFRRGDILIAKITPCFENGKGAYTDNLLSEHGFGSTEFHVLRTNSKVNAKYIFYHTVSEKFRKKLEREMTGSAGQKRVPAISIQKYKIFLPSSNEQNFIIEILSTADHEIDLLQKSIDAEKQKKKALMQLLLTGKVRVKI